MNKPVIFLFMVLFAFMIEPYSVIAQSKKNLIGSWNSVAPDAPEGYVNGIMKITKDSVFSKFTGYVEKYTSTFMKFEKDSLIFNINEINVLCTLKFENKTKLNGIAVWNGGQSPLTLTKINNPKSKK